MGFFRILRIGMIFPLLAVVFCYAAKADAPDSQDPTVELFDRVLILPAYDMSKIYGEDVSMRGPLSGQVFITSQVAPEATDFLISRLNNQLSAMFDIEVMEPAADFDASSMIGIEPAAGHRSERIPIIQQYGRQMGVDGVICTYIYGFRKRVGTAYGVDKPAMVSFELNLISVATGRLVWQAHFSETQKSLNEDALHIGQFIERKGRWITAEEMAAKAVENLLKSFPQPPEQK